MDKKLVLIGAVCIFFLVLGVEYAFGDLLSEGSKWDGFKDCHTTAGDPIILCVGFNTIHQDDSDIKTLLASEISNQGIIIEQNKEIIKLLTPAQKQIPKIGKCIPSGKGLICDP